MSKSMINVSLIMTEITKGMKSVGPKYIYKYKNKALIEYQLHFLKKYKTKMNLNLLVGFGSDRVEKQLQKQKNIKINYLYNPNYTNEESGGNFEIAINNFNPQKESGLLLINNGIIANINWERYINKISKKSNILFYTDELCHNFNLGFTDTGDYLFYDLPNTWLEVLYISKASAMSLQKKPISSIHKNMFLFEIINEMKNNDYAFESCKIPGKKIFKFNSPKDQKMLSKFL